MSWCVDVYFGFYIDVVVVEKGDVVVSDVVASDVVARDDFENDVVAVVGGVNEKVVGDVVGKLS